MNNVHSLSLVRGERVEQEIRNLADSHSAITYSEVALEKLARMGGDMLDIVLGLRDLKFATFEIAPSEGGHVRCHLSSLEGINPLVVTLKYDVGTLHMEIVDVELDI